MSRDDVRNQQLVTTPDEGMPVVDQQQATSLRAGRVRNNADTAANKSSDVEAVAEKAPAALRA